MSMSPSFKLKTPFVINETHDQAEVYYVLLGRAAGSDPAKRKCDYCLWPFHEVDGKRVYAPSERLIRGSIPDLSVPQADPLAEDMRKKVLIGDDTIIMGLSVLLGQPAA